MPSPRRARPPGHERPRCPPVLKLGDKSDVRGMRTEQGFDSAASPGKLAHDGLASVASFEGELIRERTASRRAGIAAGLRQTRSERPIGRPRKPIRELVQRIREERAEGLNRSGVAQHAGILAGRYQKVGVSPRSENPSVENGRGDFRTQASVLRQPSCSTNGPISSVGPIRLNLCSLLVYASAVRWGLERASCEFWSGSSPRFSYWYFLQHCRGLLVPALVDMGCSLPRPCPGPS